MPDSISADDNLPYIEEISVADSIIQLGKMKTTLLVMHYNNEILIFLDKNKYFDTIDYELEVEFARESTKLNDLLESLSIGTISTKGKYFRFYEMLQKVLSDSMQK